MADKNDFQDPDFLKKNQYSNSNNLNARAELHRRFSTAAAPFHPWVFAQLDLQSGERVLECGCGPGWLWRHNLDRIPELAAVTLTDLSTGMVAEAEAALADSGHAFQFEATAIDQLPYADDSFDVVIANHMLYHVPDLPAALAEVRRVLRPNGRFYAATNGEAHMREITKLGQTLFPDAVAALQRSRLQRSAGMSLPFRLENGRDILGPYFSQIELSLYEDSLRVTEAEPLLAYALSTVEETAVPPAVRQTLLAEINRRIAEEGAIHITKATGLFICRP